ncbi:hypothetical protein [Streptomyces sp. NPDC001315]|uniref:hypothetical protein n=1 Tax=Streptomyces sp. NPDC001315 TaxID=3364562 RepID=UPI0036C997F1
MTAPDGTQRLTKTGQVRRLTPEDVDGVLRFVELEELDEPTLTRELAGGGDYLWMGLDLPNGGLGAVHRSMKWGNYLLLKGVFVNEPLRGSGAALELAFALRDAARHGGYAGLAAWVEPHKPEAALARMLRLRSTGPLVHRFEVRVPDDAPNAAASAHSCGPITVDLPESAASTPLVADLLTDDSPTTVHWVHDRHRLVLSGFPPRSISDLGLVLSAVAPVARSKGARYLEFPVPAADLSAAFFLASVKARRLSRTPVRLGRVDFGAAHQGTVRDGRRQVRA